MKNKHDDDDDDDDKVGHYVKQLLRQDRRTAVAVGRAQRKL